MDQKHHLPVKTVKYNPFKSVCYASAGAIAGFRREPNLVFQAIIGFIAALVLVYKQFYLLAMINLIMMFFTLSSEFFNTSIEAVCDLVHPSFSPKVKLIKDLAAAGVWMIALAWLVFLLYCAYRLLISL